MAISEADMQEIDGAINEHFQDDVDLLLRVCHYVAQATPQKVLALKIANRHNIFREHVLQELVNLSQNANSEADFANDVNDMVNIYNVQNQNNNDEDIFNDSVRIMRENYLGNAREVMSNNNMNMTVKPCAGFGMLNVLQRVMQSAPATKTVMTRISYSISQRSLGIVAANSRALVRATPLSAGLPLVAKSAGKMAMRQISKNGSLVVRSTTNVAKSEILQHVGKSMQLVAVALIVVELSATVLQNIFDWYDNKISGKRCLKNIVDDCVVVGAGVGGGWAAGMLTGMAFGPVGAVVGAVAGGVTATFVAKRFANWLTNEFFGLTASQALDNAYAFFHLRPCCSNADLNTEYKHLARRFHPDKAGDTYKVEWEQMQYNFALITAAREPRVRTAIR